jgi:hypothetical protein
MGRLLFAVMVAASAGLLAEAALDHTRSDAATGPATIRVTTREVRYQRVDTGVRGRTPGDMEIVTALIYNRRVTQRAIGHLELVCTFTIRPSRTCQGAIFLPRGKLVIGGPIFVRSFYQVAVLGGTGLYDNARGFMTGTRIRRSPRGELLLVRLVG